MCTWISRSFLGSRLDPGLEKIGFIGPLLIPTLSGLTFNLASIDITLSGPEFSSLYWSQSWVNWILIWPLLIQPWVDQNFLVSVDPNLEEILQILSAKKFTLNFLKKFRANFLATLSGPEFSSLYWSQSRGDYKFL